MHNIGCRKENSISEIRNLWSMGKAGGIYGSKKKGRDSGDEGRITNTVICIWAEGRVTQGYQYFSLRALKKNRVSNKENIV